MGKPIHSPEGRHAIFTHRSIEYISVLVCDDGDSIMYIMFPSISFWLGEPMNIYGGFMFISTKVYIVLNDLFIRDREAMAEDIMHGYGYNRVMALSELIKTCCTMEEEAQMQEVKSFANRITAKSARH